MGSFYHVYLSSRGEVRNNFCCFLYDALKAEGYIPFMDTDDLVKGDELNMQQPIENSASAIVVFSEKYASSRYCLDELVLIMERKRTSAYFFLPIFYHVRPGDVRFQLGRFGAALEKHKIRHGEEERVEMWKAALKEATNISGMHFDGSRPLSDFIRNIVNLFRRRVDVKSPELKPESAVQPETLVDVKRTCLSSTVGSFYHVYLSFRVELRNNFGCFLYDALKAEGYIPFMYDEVLVGGTELTSTIPQAIMNSASAIVVFTEDYASARYCLDELVLIMERKRTSAYFFLPIFYHVRPTDVWRQSGSFGASLEKDMIRHGEEERVEMWKAALKEAAAFSGMHFDGFRPLSDSIRSIVNLFRDRFDVKSPELKPESAVQLGTLVDVRTSSTKPEIFFNFHEETRHSFTHILVDAFKDAGLETFMECGRNMVAGKEKQQEIAVIIKQVIKDSLSAVVVFSKNYVHSVPCLDQLVLILKRRELSRFFVLPIYYNVKPEEVHQWANYGVATGKYKSALVQAAAIPGEQYQGELNEFIQNFIDLFRKKFSTKYPELSLAPRKNPTIDKYQRLLPFSKARTIQRQL